MPAAKKRKLTPMMRQYMDVKVHYPDDIVFFRMGDFFEMFFDDAILAAKELDITQTYRNKMDDNPIPMAGIPHHAYHNYVNRLVEKGYTVVICDQVEDARIAREAKRTVRREVTRVITPGMVLDPDALDSRSNHYLMAAFFGKKKHGLSILDLTTGVFRITEVSQEELLTETLRIQPRELLISEDQAATATGERFLQALEGVSIKNRDSRHFNLQNATNKLCDYFEVMNLDGFGVSKFKVGIRAAGAIIEYVEETQKTHLPHINRLQPYYLQEFMKVDEVTRSNLELLESSFHRTRKGSLFGLMDGSVTAMGGRKIRHWLLYPLLSQQRIERRLDAVELFFSHSMVRESLRTILKDIHDLERLNGKIASGIAGPRDLAKLRQSLEMIPQLSELLEELGEEGEKLEALRELDKIEEVKNDILQVLRDEPPVHLKDGNIIREGYHAELDRQRDISANGKDHLLRMEAEERERTGIKSLKIKFNKVFNYYIEVSKANMHLLEKVNQDERYKAKQTLVNHTRFITVELKEFEEEILGAEDKITSLEEQLFTELRQRISQYSARITALADRIAQLDALSTFAELAVQQDYTRPTLVQEPILEIEEGRHPIVEQMMPVGEFKSNGVQMHPDQAQFILITGPNMAGKSTIMRQVALIALMAQVGSFVPARKAQIGICDQIFTRVGASDNLAEGKSTFMVEMTETANILHNTTSSSLVILDEIGRGTSTFDGISIAWAVVEYLHNHVGCRTLFATHYHELTELESTLSNFHNMSVLIKEYEDQIIFLHDLVDGGSSRSYGIEVARLAGLPGRVVRRARRVLKGLEEGKLPTKGLIGGLHTKGKRPGLENQLPLFVPANTIEPEPSPIEEELKLLDVNQLTPMAALQLLHEWKEQWG